jgi:putrescine aminotransferase
MPREKVRTLIGIDEAERLSVESVHDMYREYVNSAQVRLMTSFGFGHDLIDHAEGNYLYTTDGRRIMDVTGGVGVLNHGHNHPRIVAARQRFQQARRMEVHKTIFSPYLAALGHNLAAVLPGDLNKSFLPNSGAEAVEGAVKLAYKYHGGRRGTVLHSDISFHGKLLGSGSLTAGSRDQFRFPGIPGVVSYPYDDLAALRRAVDMATRPDGRCDVYAILVEPFSASTMRWCGEEFLRGLRELCTERDIVLIFDEIYTGWGKTGSLFYFMRYPGLLPDVVTTSKSFGGGKSSISAYVARDPIFHKAYENLTDAMLQSTSTTYYGFGEEAATAIEAIAVAVEEDFPARARHIGSVLGPGLRRIMGDHGDVIADVQGAGALWGVFLRHNLTLLDLVTTLVPVGFAKDPLFATKVVTSAVLDALYRDHDIYAYYTLNGRSPMVVAPSLVTSEADVRHFLDCFDATLTVGLPKLLTRFVRERVASLW